MTNVITKVYDFRWNLLTDEEFTELKTELSTNTDIKPMQVIEPNTELNVSYTRLKTKIIINWEEIFSSKTKLVPVILKDRNDIIYYGNDEKEYLSDMDIYQLNHIADSIIKILNKSELFNILFKIKFVHIVLSAFYGDSIIKKQFDYVKYSITDFKALFTNFEKEYKSDYIQKTNCDTLKIIEEKCNIKLFSRAPYYIDHKELLVLFTTLYTIHFMNPSVFKEVYINKLYEYFIIPFDSYNKNKKIIKIYLDYLENIIF
jgi:hypothetical protein